MPSEARTHPPQAPRILIVDDDASQRSLLDSFLVSQGFETLPVSSGEQALERLRAEPFSMMISDVRMPGLSGLETLRRARKEHLVALYLDAQNRLLAKETITIGSLNTTRTHPREILYPAIQHLALGFVLVHNHPSGSLTPSVDDVEFTRSVRRAGEMIGIELYDHLIVSARGFVSLKEKGLL